MNITMRNGFTLIELLVVIAIIGLLASVVMASLNSAREKGRDSRRLADIKQFQLALELYYDENGRYPGNSWYHSYNSSWDTLGGLLSDYMPTMPHDPAEQSTAATSGGYSYGYHSWGGAYYMVVFNTENDDPQREANDGVWHSNGTTFYDYGNAIVWGVNGN